MQVAGPELEIGAQCEAILRSLPEWFGIEEALLDYADATVRLPTFALMEKGKAIGFISLNQHFPESTEVHCMAIHRRQRRKGFGRVLLEHAEYWLRRRHTRFLQVKTVSASLDDAAYEQTRGFYARMGFVPLQEFPELWDPHSPCIQMIKVL